MLQKELNAETKEIRARAYALYKEHGFKNGEDFRRNQLFAAESMKRGVFFHPHHNWFLSAALEREDIEKSINVADEAFKEVKRVFG